MTTLSFNIAYTYPIYEGNKIRAVFRNTICWPIDSLTGWLTHWLTDQWSHWLTHSFNHSLSNSHTRHHTVFTFLTCFPTMIYFAYFGNVTNPSDEVFRWRLYIFCCRYALAQVNAYYKNIDKHTAHTISKSKSKKILFKTNFCKTNNISTISGPFY